MKGYIELDAATGKYTLKTAEGVVLAKSKHQDYWEYHKPKGDIPYLEKISEFVYAAPTTDHSSAGQSVVADSSSLAEFDIDERFQILEDYVDMVATRISPSCTIIGQGGLGKTHTVLAALARHKLLPAEDLPTLSNANLPMLDPDDLTLDQQIELAAYWAAVEQRKTAFTMIKGYSTAKGLYRTLFENRENLVVFDDCDAVINDKTGVDLLKSALDSYDERIITWNSELQGSDLPKKFFFKGSIIFISNMPMRKVPQALISRTLPADVTMTRTELIQRMRTIIKNPAFMPGFDFALKEESLDYLSTVSEDPRIDELNLRSLIHTVKMRYGKPANWKRLTLYALINAAKKEYT
jgi:hypothetical protein